MNVRVYVEKQMEGLAVFASAVGLPAMFSPRATSTLRPTDQHIRFLAEALPGKPLSMFAGVVSFSETDAVIYQEMRHADGRVAAAFRTRLVHRDTEEFEPFRWPKRTRERFTALTLQPPEASAPRSIDPDAPGLASSDITYAQVTATNAPLIGKGAVPPEHMDAHGSMSPYWFIGRISDSVPNLLYAWRQRAAEASGAQRIGAAVLEYRLRYHRFPRAGDLFEIYSSLGAVSGKTHSLIHWVMDPVSGQPWATTQAVAISLDLDQRKAIAAPPERIAELERIAPRGLAL